MDFDTFVTTLYTLIDDLYRVRCAPHKPRRRGARARLSDSEVVTLLVLGQWLRLSERALVRRAQLVWGAYFPRMLSQSAFNRRGRDLAGVLPALVVAVADELGAATAGYLVLDCVPVPLARRCRGTRHRRFGEEAAIGRGGADRDWYFGGKLLVAATDSGAVTGFVVGPANTDDRFLADALLCWRGDPWATPWTAADLPPSHHRGGRRVGPTGPIWPRGAAGHFDAGPYLADRGFRGRRWAAHWQADYGGTVLTHASYTGATAPADRRAHAAARQLIETLNAHLCADLTLAFPDAHTRQGLLTRLAAKLLALNCGLWLNRLHHRPALALPTLLAA